MDFGRRNKVDSNFSTSSMTDLVFLLLIFFIILSTLVSPYALPVDLPESSNRPKDKKEGITVSIYPNESFFVNKEKVEPSQLEGVLESKMETMPNKAIILHVDQVVPTGVTVSVLDIAKRNKWKIILATKAKES